MFKIAFIGQKGIPASQGGIETHVEELSIRLAKKGHDVFVYTRPYFVPKEYKKYENVNLVSLPSLKTKNLDAISHTFISTLSAIFREKVDIIHYQGVGPNLLAWLPKILSKRVRVVATIHSPDWEHQKWSLPARIMLKLGCKSGCKFSDEALAVSRGLQKYCLANHKSDVTYIPNGVGIPEKTNDKSEQILENFNLQSKQYLLVVTRLVKHKGVHYLIEAFKNIKEKLDDNLKFHNFKLVIVGSTAFTENYQNYLLKLTQDRGDIIFTGVQTGASLDALFRNTYLYVQPSESEGLSISVLEAMSYGDAVLVSDIEENTALIAGNSQTGAIGFDFKNKNVSDLSNKLETLIKHPTIVRKVGIKAQAYVKLYFNWEEIVARTEKLYKNAILIKDKVHGKLRMALARYIF